MIQPRLVVGPADDPYEREAERAADLAVAAGRVAPGGAAARIATPAGLTGIVRRALGRTDPQTRKPDERKDEDDRKKVVQKRSTDSGRLPLPPTSM